MKKTMTAWMYQFEGDMEPDLRTLAFNEGDAYGKAIEIIADPGYFWTGPYGKTVPVVLTIAPNKKVKAKITPRRKEDDYR